MNLGVDLNRNYEFKFAYNNQGSSGAPCAEDFRGPYAFSESETSSVKSFIEEHPSIKMAFNFHAHGNLFIHPFNFDDARNSVLHGQFKEIALVYDEIWNECKLPQGSIKGNG
jgi:hypothetical protein